MTVADLISALQTLDPDTQLTGVWPAIARGMLKAHGDETVVAEKHDDFDRALFVEMVKTAPMKFNRVGATGINTEHLPAVEAMGLSDDQLEDFLKPTVVPNTFHDHAREWPVELRMTPRADGDAS